MAGILRGEIRWAELTRGNQQAGLRPVLILSHDVFNARSGTVIAIALTSQPQRAGFPLTLELARPKLTKRLVGQDQPDSLARTAWRWHYAAAASRRLTTGSPCVVRASRIS